MPKWPHLPFPDIAFDTGGTPVSQTFEDIYYSPADGIAESEAVFLDGIDAPNCWRGKSVFTIGETGFGTGLNFLLTWNRWQQTASGDDRLNFVSVEGYPLTAGQLATALKPFDNLSPLASELIQNYPIRHGGFHRLSFEHGRVNLTLLFGDAEKMLERLSARVDAWFLDGFAPSRNPGMWTENLFSKIAALSAPEAVFATFTAAGHVKRGLQAAGFTVLKSPGFGRKRERLKGKLDTPPPNRKPYWTNPPPPLSTGSRIAIVGSGIAGSSVASALRHKGFETTVFDTTGKPGGAIAGNPAVILSPKPPAEASLSGRINASAFLDSIRRYNRLEAVHGSIWQGMRGVQALSGSQEDANRRVKALAALNWPETVARIKDEPALSPYPVACFPESGCVDPAAVCSALNSTVEKASIDKIEQTEGGWILSQDGKAIWEGDAVVLANGAHSTRLASLERVPLYPNRGQVSIIDGKGLPMVPEGSLSFDGYLSPELTIENRRVRVLGSSFTGWRNLADQGWRDINDEDHASCMNALQSALNGPGPEHFPATTFWAGLRAAPPDRIPLVGGIANEEQFLDTFSDLWKGKPPSHSPPYQAGLYILAGLGSRGYQLGPLLGDLLADMIAGDPLPFESDLVDALNPSRFMVRALKRSAI